MIVTNATVRHIPLLASPRGRGGFPIDRKRKTTPAASALVATQHFLDDAATPPCGDARSGILSDACVIPGITRAPTTQPAAAELPGQVVYCVLGVTVNTVPAPLGALRLGLVFVANPPWFNGCKLLLLYKLYPGKAWSD